MVNPINEQTLHTIQEILNSQVAEVINTRRWLPQEVVLYTLFNRTWDQDSDKTTVGFQSKLSMGLENTYWEMLLYNFNTKFYLLTIHQTQVCLAGLRKDIGCYV